MACRFYCRGGGAQGVLRVQDLSSQDSLDLRKIHTALGFKIFGPTYSINLNPPDDCRGLRAEGRVRGLRLSRCSSRLASSSYGGPVTD